MRLNRIISTLTFTFIVISALAQNNYKVASSSRLRVREYPIISANVIGVLDSGQQIEVLSISNGWAKINYKSAIGYVSEKYISPLPTPEPSKPKSKKDILEEEKPITTPQLEIEEYLKIKSVGENGVNTPLSFGHGLSDNINLYLAVNAGLGYSSFIWNNGSVNGMMAYSADIAAQLYFESDVSFIPVNWYSEIAIGYVKKGAAKYDMNYVHVHLYPFGYRIPVDPINVVLKAGPTLGFALNDFDDQWSSDIQVGFGGGFHIEWKQFAVGCNVEYNFTEVSSEVSSSRGQTLNNLAILGTISYKFAKFRHK